MCSDMMYPDETPIYRRPNPLSANELAGLYDLWSKKAYWSCNETRALIMRVDPEKWAPGRLPFGWPEYLKAETILDLLKRKFGGRVLPLEPRPWVERRSSWPFPVAREPAPAAPIQVRAAQVIATTARHWLGRP